MLVKGISGLCDGSLCKLPSVEYFSDIFNLACVLGICRGKLMNSYLCSVVNAYAVNYKVVTMRLPQRNSGIQLAE